MTLRISFGKLSFLNKAINPSPLIDIHDTCYIKWNDKWNDKWRLLKNSRNIKEDLFVNNTKYGYEILIKLRPYNKEENQFIFISDDFLNTIIGFYSDIKKEYKQNPNKQNKKYLLLAIWLKQWCKTCRKKFNNRAFLSSEYI